MLAERELTLTIEQQFWRTLGDRIRNGRLARGYGSQKDFQTALSRAGVDITLSAISQMENNVIVPTLPVLIGISKTIGRSVDWLLGLPERIVELPPPPAHSPDATTIAESIDALPAEIKFSVVKEVKDLLQDRYDEYDRNRRYHELLRLISERGGDDILESVKHILNGTGIVRRQ